jgi:hypothetical protein
MNLIPKPLRRPYCPPMRIASNKFGADMGRMNLTPEPHDQIVQMFVYRLKVICFDYDSRGAYWGFGAGLAPVYRAVTSDGQIEMFFRAWTRPDAISMVLETYPNATFYGSRSREPEMLWYSSSSGKIELQMTLEQAKAMSHSGQCDADVAAMRKAPGIAKQIAGIKPDVLREELREYGAWDEDHLADHNQNLDRLLWLAAGEIVDEYVSANKSHLVKQMTARKGRIAQRG